MKTRLRNILSIAALTLLPITQSAFADAVPLDRIAAVVNEGVVMQSELDQRIAITREQLTARNTKLPPENIFRKQVLNRLILESIQIQLASQQGIRISDSQLNSTLSSIAAQNSLSLEQFREALIAEGRNYTQVREQIRGELLLNSVQQNMVNRRIRVSEQEIEHFLNSETGQNHLSAEYSLGHILISTPSQASPEIIQQAEKTARDIYTQLTNGENFSELAVKYSNAPNALNGGDLGWRKAAELPEVLGDAARQLSPTEFSKPIRSASGFHIILMKDKRGGSVQLVEQRLVSHILLKPSEIRTSTQAHEQIMTLKQRLDQGESFASLAKEYSDDPASGSDGGSLGWTQNGQMVPEFEEVMNNTPTGQVSAPFESRFGWHILTVIDKRTQDLGEEMQENRARAAIQKRKFNEELTNWLREIRSQAYVDIKE